MPNPFTPARRAEPSTGPTTPSGISSAHTTPGEPDLTEPDYSVMDKKSLTALAKQRGLRTWGTAAQLIERLRQWDRER